MEQLYSASSPDLVHRCQTALQEVQRSPQGAGVATYLLGTPSRNCRYFGALTYSVVILNHQLDEIQVHDLIRLLHLHVQNLLKDEDAISSNTFIIQKLFSDLLLLFSKYSLVFPNPILLFVHILVPLNEPMQAILGQLTPVQLNLILVYFSALVEDLFRTSANACAVHRSVFENSLPILISTYDFLSQLKATNRLLYTLALQSLKSLSVWISYIANVNAEIRYDAQHIFSLTQYIFLFFKEPFQNNNDEYLSVMQLCLRILCDVFETNPNLLTFDEKQAILCLLFDASSWGFHFQSQILLKELRNNHEEEVNAFVDLTLSVLQCFMLRISKTIMELTTQRIIENVLIITDLSEASFEDDPVSERMLEFWEELTNVYIDSADMFDTLFEQNDHPQFKAEFENHRAQIFQQICHIYWKKVRLPSFEVYFTVRGEFNSYRQTVADFFLVAYSFLKTDLYKILSESLLLSSKSKDVIDMEATLFLLYNINNEAVYFESQANALLLFSSVIMQSNILHWLLELASDYSHNRLVIATFVQYLSSNVFFFLTDKGSGYLGEVLDLIFRIIVSNDHSLSLLASKTATRICEKCSRYLVQFLPNLEAITLEMLRNSNIDGLIRLRMFIVYTVVARTTTDEIQFSGSLKGIASQIRDASLMVLNTVLESASCSELQEEYLTSLLSSLVGIAKGSSLSDEFKDNMTEKEVTTYKKYWQDDPTQFKPLVLSVLNFFLMENKVVRQMPIVVEKCLLVVRAGFGEEYGGPFDFGQETVLKLVEAIMSELRNPNAVPQVFSLIESFINVNFRTLDPTQVQELMENVFAKNLDFLKADPDLLKGAIDVFTKFIESKPALIIRSEFFELMILPCAVDGLHANERFILKSISKFWSTLLNLKRGAQYDHEIVQSFVTHMDWGRTLTSNLVNSFLKGPRSNLDNFYSIFRSLLAKYPLQFKAWLTESVQLESVLSLVDLKEREVFVNLLILTRGRRTANDVLKAFWLKSNRMVEYNLQNF